MTPTDSSIHHSCRIERQVEGIETTDGAGVRLTRVLTQDLQRRLDPWLMLDVFATDDPEDYIAGFPDHPHRGFETVTYMLAGRMRHRDSAGHEGLIENGGMQWMTVGSGLVHSELPEQEDGRMEGFQFWLNLPSGDKMCAPSYRNYGAAELPRFRTAGGVSATVIAGASHGVAGAVERPATAPLMLDLILPAGASFDQPLPAAHNACFFVHQGSVTVEGTRVPARRLAILANPADDAAADGVRIVAATEARVMLFAGRPLAEPIAQHGPFVMNTQQQIYQAVMDFRDGRLA
ncbi:MAG: pirin family protein [Rhodocyclaceae bacterium]|jgi:redox-sensitive bicupin YhaK (pirin superfamily)|nr:pirin family protein [Rhodocyclaceae bacterium]